jgi:hypothetical protein
MPTQNYKPILQHEGHKPWCGVNAIKPCDCKRGAKRHISGKKSTCAGSKMTSRELCEKLGITSSALAKRMLQLKLRPHRMRIGKRQTRGYCVPENMGIERLLGNLRIMGIAAA